MSPTPDVLALAMGEPAGIGPDITLAAWHARDAEAVPLFYLLADPDLIRARAQRLGLTTPIIVLDHPTPPERFAAQVADTFATALPVVPLAGHMRDAPGQPNPATAAAVLEAIRRGVDDVRRGAASALVTNPIAKDVLYAAGFAHPGHTEFLAELADDGWPGTAPHIAVMMLAADDLRVVPVTIHIPLKNVAQALTAPLLRATLRTVIAALRSDYGIATPRIICTGLNPHAGENGEIGREDIDLIAPVVQEFAQAGAHISGPVSADTCFHAEARANADVIVAMYHDQALIPIKTLAFDRGVNVTLGLPFIRTSPDHGTAFAIAGTGKANPHSLIEALKHAAARAEIRRDRTAALENAV